MEKILIAATEISPETFPIKLTEKAIEMALRATNEEKGDLFLRVSIRGGGCAGMKYNLDIDDQISPYDVQCHIGELKVVSDAFSLKHLVNTTIDFQETLDGAGFSFQNPNARKTCGCGSSFSG